MEEKLITYAQGTTHNTLAVSCTKTYHSNKQRTLLT